MTSIGKKWSLRRVSDQNGLFKLASLDQRPPIEDPIAKVLGTEGLTNNKLLQREVVNFKRLLIETFQSRSSGLLLDPSFAVPGCLGALDARKGLMVSLEDPHSPKSSEGATRTSPIKNWSVGKIKRLGADAVKLLIWYRPDGPESINQLQRNLVRAVGEDCVRYDIPFFLELLSYSPSNASSTKDTSQRLDSKADVVLKSVEEFAKPEYNVDVFMVESPVDAPNVPGVGNGDWNEVQSLFDRLGVLASRPWVILSMGADMAQFHHIMTHAYKAGSSGYLAGRAYWLDALACYPDWERMLTEINGSPLEYLDALNVLTDEKALPWHKVKNVEGCQEVTLLLDKEFCLSYDY
ncbi:MAG: tagatose 1,6-diphosphate aldolase [Halopseudomonas aestusnigri]